jgi:uncharacterized membrane protein YcaP (DUF421 family)
MCLRARQWDMFDQEIASSWTRLGLVVVSSTGMLIGVIVYVRIAGLRSLSKMSSFDFVVTVAYGSLLASTATSGSSLIDGLSAAAVLLVCQFLIALGRSRFRLGHLVDNAPLLLMLDGQFIEANLRKSRVTEQDVRGRLRDANVLSRDEVRAVVLETTGDVSVLHGSRLLDPDLLFDVRK